MAGNNNSKHVPDKHFYNVPGDDEVNEAVRKAVETPDDGTWLFRPPGHRHVMKQRKDK